MTIQNQQLAQRARMINDQRLQIVHPTAAKEITYLREKLKSTETMLMFFFAETARLTKELKRLRKIKESPCITQQTSKQ